jgi:hypothetical protein
MMSVRIVGNADDLADGLFKADWKQRMDRTSKG